MKRSLKKDAFFQVAKELFGEDGIAETTFRNIGKSGRDTVIPRLLTHHYGSKEKFFFKSKMVILHQFTGVLRDAAEDSPGGQTEVLNFCDDCPDFPANQRSNRFLLVRSPLAPTGNPA